MKKLKPFLLVLLGISIGASAMYFFLQAKPGLLLASRAFEMAKDLKGDSQMGLFQNAPPAQDDFFSDEETLAEFRKMREQMLAQLKNKNFDSAFAEEDFAGLMNAFRGGMNGKSSDKVRIRADKDFIYYEIEIEGAEGNRIDTKVEKGMISVSGEIKRKLGAAGQSGSYTSRFERSFPVPEDADADRMETITEPGLLVLKFPRKKHR